MARKTKIGRNDRCPCGSGKKYKRCCLAEHEAARGAGGPDVGDAGVAQLTMDDLDPATAMRHARRLAELLAPGGALSSIRFGRQSLVDAVGRHIDAFEAAEASADPELALLGPAHGIETPRPPHERLCDVCWPDLRATPFLRQAEARCRALLHDDRAASDARETAAFGLMACSAGEGPELAPLIAQIVFGRQLVTLRGATPAVDRALDLILGPQPSEPALDQALEALSAREAEERARLESALKAAVEDAALWLAAPDAPQVLAGDQFVGLLGVFSLPPDDQWADEAARAIEALGIPAALLAAADAALDAAPTDARAQALKQAAAVSPLRLCAAMLGNEALQLRLREDGEEPLVAAAVQTGPPGRAAQRAYADWLEARDEAEAAGRVRGALPALEALDAAPAAEEPPAP